MLETDPLSAKIDEVLAMRLAMFGGRDGEEALRLEGSLSTSSRQHGRRSTRGISAQLGRRRSGEHLQAVANGQIKRLLVNFPPRCIEDVGDVGMCWPALDLGSTAALLSRRAPR